MADDADQEPTDDARPPAGEGPSDSSLLRQVRQGDKEAAQLLYERYIGRLRALAKAWHPADLNGRVDADDIVQSVLGSFFRGVLHGSYDVPAGEEIWNLFLVITLNKIRAKGQYHRAAKRDIRQTAGGEGIDQLPSELRSDNEATALLRMSVEEVLDRMTKDQSRIIRLRMEDHGVEEIAKMVGRSKRSVERILQEGRVRLGELLKD
jgi:RNA polymerase sigma factor (sigma-70 family)